MVHVAEATTKTQKGIAYKRNRSEKKRNRARDAWEGIHPLAGEKGEIEKRKSNGKTKQKKYASPENGETDPNEILGIDLLVKLIEEGFQLYPGEMALLNEEAGCPSRAIISPSVEDRDFRRMCSLLEKHLGQDRTIFPHCVGNKGRSVRVFSEHILEDMEDMEDMEDPKKTAESVIFEIPIFKKNRKRLAPLNEKFMSKFEFDSGIDVARLMKGDLNYMETYEVCDFDTLRL